MTELGFVEMLAELWSKRCTGVSLPLRVTDMGLVASVDGARAGNADNRNALGTSNWSRKGYLGPFSRFALAPSRSEASESTASLPCSSLWVSRQLGGAFVSLLMSKAETAFGNGNGLPISQ
jgi:hypothetical protein